MLDASPRDISMTGSSYGSQDVIALFLLKSSLKLEILP